MHKQQMEKHTIALVVMERISKKYRRITESSFGFSSRMYHGEKPATQGLAIKKCKVTIEAESMKQAVREFYLLDDVSRSKYPLK